MGLVLFGKGTRAPMSLGIFGGYPGCNVGYTTFRDANVDELPDRLEALRGAEQVTSSGGSSSSPTATSSTSASWAAAATATLDRDPELVLRDVLAGLVTEEPARDVYGVVVDGDDVDAEATRAAPARAARSAARPSFDGPDERADVPRTGRRLSEYLQRTEADRRSAHGAVPRSRPDGADWKEHAVLRRIPVEEAGPHRTASGEFFLIEACCPGCGTLLDAELAAGGDPPLHDRVHRWPDT